jgi:hypothetical protein
MSLSKGVALVSFAIAASLNQLRWWDHCAACVGAEGLRIAKCRPLLIPEISQNQTIRSYFTLSGASRRLEAVRFSDFELKAPQRHYEDPSEHLTMPIMLRDP